MALILDPGGAVQRKLYTKLCTKEAGEERPYANDRAENTCVVGVYDQKKM